jgi:hypothetical protein
MSGQSYFATDGRSVGKSVSQSVSQSVRTSVLALRPLGLILISGNLHMNLE